MEKLIEKQQYVKKLTHLICDVCKKEYSIDDDFMEIQEFLRISFTGGYDSVFGDGTRVSLDICQHCLLKKLGKYFITIKEEDY